MISLQHKDGKPKNHKFPQVHRIFLSYLVFILMLVVSAFVTTCLNLTYVASLSSASASSPSSPSPSNTSFPPPDPSLFPS